MTRRLNDAVSALDDYRKAKAPPQDDLFSTIQAVTRAAGMTVAGARAGPARAGNVADVAIANVSRSAVGVDATFGAGGDVLAVLLSDWAAAAFAIRSTRSVAAVARLRAIQPVGEAAVIVYARSGEAAVAERGALTAGGAMIKLNACVLFRCL